MQTGDEKITCTWSPSVITSRWRSARFSAGWPLIATRLPPTASIQRPARVTPRSRAAATRRRPRTTTSLARARADARRGTGSETPAARRRRTHRMRPLIARPPRASRPKADGRRDRSRRWRAPATDGDRSGTVATPGTFTSVANLLVRTDAWHDSQVRVGHVRRVVEDRSRHHRLGDAHRRHARSAGIELMALEARREQRLEPVGALDAFVFGGRRGHARRTLDLVEPRARRRDARGPVRRDRAWRPAPADRRDRAREASRSRSISRRSS